MCDDFSGYKQLMVQGVTEVGCLAHARRKFFDLHTAHKGPVAQRALEHIAQVYEIERELKACSADERQRGRRERSKPLLDALRDWLLLTRKKVTDGTATANALDNSLRRWQALTRFVDDGQLPVDNNHIENQMRPIAIGRNNWLFAGSLRAGQRGAAVMSLIQSARLNGQDPYAYLKDVLTRLPTHWASLVHVTVAASVATTDLTCAPTPRQDRLSARLLKRVECSYHCSCCGPLRENVLESQS